MRVRRMHVAAVAGAAALALVVSACGSSGSSEESNTETTQSEQSQAPSANAGDTGAASPSDEAPSSETESANESAANSGDQSVDAASATSLSDFGGMDALVKAAQAEGELNVVALPPDWANYGTIIKNFSDKYGIKVNSQNPNGSSAEEIQSAKTNKGTDKAPDVFDLGAAVRNASTDVFAPYKVKDWDAIPDANKESTGLWVNDYTGVMSVGYNSTKYGEITSIKDLLDKKFKGTFALNGNPTQAGAAFSGFVMTALANGGSLDNLQPGIDFYAKAKKAGTFIPIDPTPSTISSGQTGVVIDWSYNQLAARKALKKQGADWKTYVPDNAAIGSFYSQAINKDAPHPAAARLWEEYLYSPAAQNQWMAGGAQPVLLDKMKKDGTVDADAAKNLPKTSSTIIQLTDEQQKSAADFLKKNWPKIAS